MAASPKRSKRTQAELARRGIGKPPKEATTAPAEPSVANIEAARPSDSGGDK